MSAFEKRHIWIVRWRPNHPDGCIFGTQETKVKGFDSLELAKRFRTDILERIKVRYQADTGDFEYPKFYRSGSCGDLETPNSYDIKDIYGFVVELRCIDLNSDKVNPWEIDGHWK